MSLSNLATLLSGIGRQEEALEVAQEAVDLDRELASANPQAFTPGLAMSLGTLYETRVEAGLWEAALEANTEAVELFAELAQAFPAVYGTYLTMTRKDRVTILSALGDRQGELEDLKRLPETGRPELGP